MLVRDPEVRAICAERVHTQARPQPIAGNSRDANTGDPVQVGDEPGDEALGGLVTVGSYVVVDAVEISAGRIGDDECAALDGCGLLVGAAVYGEGRAGASRVRVR